MICDIQQNTPEVQTFRRIRKSILGQTFGYWIVISLDHTDKRNSFWLCRCKCGKEKIVCRCSLVNGDSMSCGCLKSPEITIRLKSKVEIDDNGCWNFIGKIRKDGYGRLCNKGAYYPAHRLSYIIFVEEISNEKIVCHKCDNRKCINPGHLYAGTVLDNAADRVNRGRHVTKFGENHQNAKFTEKEIVNFRNLFSNGMKISEISRTYSVPYKYLHKVISRLTWKHV